LEPKDAIQKEIHGYLHPQPEWQQKSFEFILRWSKELGFRLSSSIDYRNEAKINL
jgi:hypothetical protein